MSVELSVLVPCFNEEGNLPELVERTLRVFARREIRGEIVLVNDGSRDGTGGQIDALAAAHPGVVGVHHPTNRGIAAGWRTALEHSRGRYVCTIDADLQYQPEAIALLHREMRFSHADLVQGWRSSLERHQYDHRYYLSRGLDYLLKLAFAMHEHDVKSGFVLYRREVFEDILRDAPKYFYFQHMITVVAKARGYSIRQVETLFAERHAGHSFIGRIPVRMIARTFVDIARAFAETRVREAKDESLALALEAGSPAPSALPSGGRVRTSRASPPWHHPLTSRNAPRYLAELRRTQWLSADRILELQLRRLRRLVQHAHQHVGYWREQLQAAGLAPDAIRSLDDVRRIPMLGKDALRENLYFDLLAVNSNKRKITKVVSCGSKGEPLPLFVDRLQLDLRWANRVRAAEWTGFRAGDRHVRVLCSTAPLGATDILRALLGGMLAGARLVRAPALDEQTLRAIVGRLARDRPGLLEADGETLAIVSHFLRARGIAGRGARAVASAGQTMPDAARAIIEHELGAPLFDTYRTGELGAIAQECDAHAGYHVNAESYLVEVLRDGRPAAEGELGEVVVTDLNSFSVPLLRYRIGDLAVATTRACPCGRGLPLLPRIVGRPPAAVLAADGRYVPAGAFADVFDRYDYAIRRYQVVQERADAIEVRLVRRSRFTAETERAIRATLTRVVGSATTIALTFVDAIAPDPDGRIPVCACRIPLPLLPEAAPAPQAARHAAGRAN